ncbi:SPOR domain-containing protein [Algiphilus sp. W345]|uniref:SPOR domain-containing protein n=1 Tax=Banduia mediterranea TaxID=3075609 RepID=A0ABU2WJZ3_9GAMM|nr:SPOR domain-containing protein [Algiphilus sp. W345]MDT0498203.1 SPOR domain-containing protein [Algiphilus sp. W345]
MDERLVQRLLGAAVVFGLIFVLSLLLPAPGEIDDQEQQAQGVTIDLHTPQTRAEPPRPESEIAAVDTPQAAKVIEDKSTAAPPTEEFRPTRANPPMAPNPRSQPPEAEPEPEPIEEPVKSKPKPKEVPPPAAKPEPKPEPVPVEKPPAPQTPTPVAGGSYWVQVVALSEWERAHALLNALESLGYRGMIQQSESAGRPIFRVRVGAYGTRDEAAAAQRALAGSGYGQTAIVSGE